MDATEQPQEPALPELVEFLQDYALQNPGCSKSQLQTAAATQLSLKRDRSIFHNSNFAVRFCQVKSGNFNGTAISLKNVVKYNAVPILVCVVRSRGVELLLSNATFIEKVSHSSQRLSFDKIVGSVNGPNIMRHFAGIENSPENFDALFESHREFDLEENISRIVESTKSIVARGARFKPNQNERAHILSAAELASSPKAYNIDKTLRLLASGRSLLCFFLVGIDRLHRKVHTRLVSILDEKILAATRIQVHWAGRNSAVTQLAADWSAIFAEGFQERIDVVQAKQFLSSLMEFRSSAPQD